MSRGVAHHGFPKTLRILSRSEFRRVYEEGQRRSNALCTMFFRSNGLGRTRLGITTPTRLGHAVLRNRMRRRLREIFRLHRHSFEAGWDVVLNPRPKVASISFQNLEREMLKLFGQLPRAGQENSPRPKTWC